MTTDHQPQESPENNRDQSPIENQGTQDIAGNSANPGNPGNSGNTANPGNPDNPASSEYQIHPEKPRHHRRFKQLSGTPPTPSLRYRLHPTRGDKRMTLTIPIELHEDLEKMAHYQQHSLAEEILLRLQFSLFHNDETLFSHWLRRVLNGKLPHSSGGSSE